MKTSRTRRPTSYFLVMYLGLMIALVLITGNFPLPAQVNSPGSAIVIRGKITDAKSQELIVAAGNGALSVKVPDTTIVRGETTIDQELWLSESCPNLLEQNFQSWENLTFFRGQNRWIFLAVLGSPGKVGINGIQEVVGSTPIGSTMILNGLRVTDHPADSLL